MQLHLALAFFLAAVYAKTIVLTNDDSWISTNIRATYYKLKEAGHTVYLVAPVSQRSGWGGKFDLPYTQTLQTNGEFGYVKAGAPSWGHEPFDDHIWYFNGTPASSVAFAVNYVLPIYFKNNATVDLVVSGPNEGTNESPGLFTLSGTIGASYNSIYRNIPSVAFSGSNSNNTLYTDFLNLNDTLEPSTIYAEKVVELVQTLFKNQGTNSRTLPLGVGLNVNLPPVGYQSKNESCVNPKYVSTRLTGQYANAPDLYYNATDNTVNWQQTVFTALTVNQNGDLSLPSENFIVEHTNCQSSLSVFSIDYDANIRLYNETKALLGGLF